MSKRKILAIIFALALGVLMLITACGPATADAQDYDLGGLILVKTDELEGTSYSIAMHTMYDPDTMVMYELFANNHGLAAIRLDNADGTPKLYSPNTEVN